MRGEKTDGEEEERRELLALGERARDERRRDDREHHLEGHEDLVRDRLGVGIERLHPDTPKSDPLQSADDAAFIRAERQAVAPEDPLDRDDRHDDEALHQRAERVLLTHHPAVEEREPRGRHQEHQRAGGQHPGRVALVDLRGRSRRDGRRGRGRRRGGRRLLSVRREHGGAQHQHHCQRETESLHVTLLGK